MGYNLKPYHVERNEEFLDKVAQAVVRQGKELEVHQLNTNRQPTDIYIAAREILKSASIWPRNASDKVLVDLVKISNQGDHIVIAPIKDLESKAPFAMREVQMTDPKARAFAQLRSHEGDFISDFTFDPETDDEGEADDERAALTIKAERELGLILEHSRWEDGVWHLTFERDEEEAARRAAEAVGGIQERERRAQDLLKRLRGDE